MGASKLHSPRLHDREEQRNTQAAPPLELPAAVAVDAPASSLAMKIYVWASADNYNSITVTVYQMRYLSVETHCWMQATLHWKQEGDRNLCESW